MAEVITATTTNNNNSQTTDRNMGNKCEPISLVYLGSWSAHRLCKPRDLNIHTKHTSFPILHMQALRHLCSSLYSPKLVCSITINVTKNDPQEGSHDDDHEKQQQWRLLVILITRVMATKSSSYNSCSGIRSSQAHWKPTTRRKSLQPSTYLSIYPSTQLTYLLKLQCVCLSLSFFLSFSLCVQVL